MVVNVYFASLLMMLKKQYQRPLMSHNFPIDKIMGFKRVNPVIGCVMRNSELEDQIYEQVDMLVAMCQMQVYADCNNQEIDPMVRAGYSAALREKLIKLRALIDSVFDSYEPPTSSRVN